MKQFFRIPDVLIVIAQPEDILTDSPARPELDWSEGEDSVNA